MRLHWLHVRQGPVPLVPHIEKPLCICFTSVKDDLMIRPPSSKQYVWNLCHFEWHNYVAFHLCRFKWHNLPILRHVCFSNQFCERISIIQLHHFI